MTSVPTALLASTARAETAPRPRLVPEHKPRVLQLGKFYPPHPGGMESHLEALCGQLKEKTDLEVIVAASNSFRSSEELIDGVKVAHLGRLLTLRSAPMCPTMVRRIREAKADLVHIHWPNPAALLAYLASGHSGRLVITYHSDVVRQKVLSRVFEPVLRRGLNRADAIIVSSANYMNSSEVLRPYLKKCRVIPFGIDLKRFERPDELEVVRLRKQFGSRMILSVGRLVYYKGFDFLIEAMKSVNAHLVLVGNGPLEGELRARIRAHGLEDRVTLLTTVKDVVPVYHAAELFVLPSIVRSEAFGIVQLEAMACSKPVVNTQLDSGVPSVSLDGVTGITVPPADSKALGRAINSLLDDPGRATLGQAAYQRVREQFSLAGMAKQTLALYHEVLNSDVRPS
jgi:glycosyltransferase involved in cell wall biosynthesis